MEGSKAGVAEGGSKAAAEEGRSKASQKRRRPRPSLRLCPNLDPSLRLCPSPNPSLRLRPSQDPRAFPSLCPSLRLSTICRAIHHATRASRPLLPEWPLRLLDAWQ